MEDLIIGTQYRYVILLISALLIPKILMTFRIPSGISAFGLGCLCVNFLGWFDNSQVILVLSRLGITSLFLFAGMEIDLVEMKSQRKPLVFSIVQSLLLIIITAVAANFFLGFSFQSSLLVAVALYTPSAGFILSSLKSFELTSEEVFWIKIKAIAKEIAAVVVMCIALKMNNFSELIYTLIAIIGMASILPFIFKIYLNYIAPSAPRSEESFLIIIAFLYGVIAKELGTYYLIGGFIVGLVAGQFNHFINGPQAQRIEESLQSFYGIFIPFYFFSAGLMVDSQYFKGDGLIIGLILIVFFIPLRMGSVYLNLKYSLESFWQERKQISIALIPNLIFGLVIVGILKQKSEIPIEYLSGILIYTLVTSIIPAILFKQIPAEDYDSSRVKNG